MGTWSTKRPSEHLQIDYADHAIAVHQPKDVSHGLINNQREHFNFAFSRVLPSAFSWKLRADAGACAFGVLEATTLSHRMH